METGNSASSKITGYILGALAASSYGLNPTFALPLYADGMNPDTVLLLRYFFAIAIVAVMMFSRGRSFAVPKGTLPMLFVLGMLMSTSSLTLFESYRYMAAGIASTILFVYPVMVAVIMALFCGERLSWGTLLCTMVAMLGIVLLCRTSEGESVSLVGTLFVIASALSYAIYLVAINRKSLETIPTLTVTFYVLVFGSLLFVGRMMCGCYVLTFPTRWYLWADSFALALFPTAVSLVCTTRAIQIIGSTQTAILGALEPVTAVVMGLLLFGETVSSRQWAGILLVLTAVSFIVARGRFDMKGLARQLTRVRHMFPKGKR